MYEIILTNSKIILQLPVKPRSAKACSTWIKVHCRSQKSIYPGEMLLEEFLKPMVISQYRLAKDISVPVMCIDKICNGRSCMSADTALLRAAISEPLSNSGPASKPVTIPNVSKWICPSGLKNRLRRWNG